MSSAARTQSPASRRGRRSLSHSTPAAAPAPRSSSKKRTSSAKKKATKKEEELGGESDLIDTGRASRRRRHESPPASPERSSANAAESVHPASLSSATFTFAPAASPSPSPRRRSSLEKATLARVLADADLGKKQLGFHNDQYIEDISVESAKEEQEVGGTRQHRAKSKEKTLTLAILSLGNYRFLYKPHTVTALLVLIITLLYLAFNLETSVDPIQNLRYGAGAACLFVLILGLLIFPAGPFIRPHPLVWRFAFGLGVLYEIWLILLMFQTKDAARSSMKFFDTSLGVPVAERSYAADCSLTWTAISSNLDKFVISHFIGWMVKALILRDAVLCWVISIQWELIEILFMHMLPNFAECWWDQWILDVALANGLGIFLGCKLAKYLEMKEYKWAKYESIPSYLGKAKRAAMQFTPSSWTKVQWQSTSSINRLLGVQILILAMHLEELNAFFLKYILWVPPECNLNLFRLIIWAFVGVPSLRQIYSYMSDPNCKRIGHQTFLGLLILCTELIVIFKFGRGEFPHPMSDNVRIGFTVYLVGYVIILLFLMMRSRDHASKQHAQIETPKKAQ